MLITFGELTNLLQNCYIYTLLAYTCTSIDRLYISHDPEIFIHKSFIYHVYHNYSSAQQHLMVYFITP